MKELKGKTAIITGGSRGIGRACCVAFAQAGANVIFTYNKSKDGMLLGIFIKKSSRHIGNITINSIDWRNRHAEIGIIIGDKKSRGKGYATEAIMLAVEHAFNKLNLHKLCAGMIKGNKASRKAFKKCGFKEEAVLREHFYLNREYLDCCRLGLLKAELKKQRID